MLGRSYKSIVKCGASAGVNLLQRFLQFEEIVGEILIEIIFVIEVHDKDFVPGIARPHQIERSLIHLVPLLPHRSRIVDDDADRNRNVLVMERDDVLRLPIFKHGEGVAVECGDDVLLVVDYRGVQQDFVHVFSEDEDSLVIKVTILIVFLAGRSLRSRRRRGGRWWSSSGGRSTFGVVLRRRRLRPGQRE